MIQNQTLNYLLQKKEASLITMNSLSDEYFSDYKNEFNFIKNHLNKYGNIPDEATFLSVFPDFEIIQVNETPAYLMDQLVRDRKYRHTAETFNKVRLLLQQDKVEEAQSYMQQAAEKSFDLTAIHAIDLIHESQQRYDAYMDKVNNPGRYFVTTGFKELDAIIGGWSCQDDVATVVARNGVGKTFYVLKCAAEAAKQGKNAGIYSGEMSEDTVGYRVDTMLGNIANGALVHGGPSVKNEYKNFLEELNSYEGTLKVLTPKALGHTARVSDLRAFIEREKLDILFVDQHSLLEDERGGKSGPEMASHISTDIKALQMMKQIPIVCVAQQNREKTESGIQDSTQIAGSDKIGQDSSVILFLERKEDLMLVHITKSRNSGAGQTLTYRIDLNKGYWTYVPDGDNPIPQMENAGGYLPEESAYTNYSADEVF